MKTRLYFIVILSLCTSFAFGSQFFPGSFGPGPGSYRGNMFSGYSPASTYVGIFPGYRTGFFQRYHSGMGLGESAYSRMGRPRENYMGYYYNDYPLSFFMLNRGWGMRGRYWQKNLYTSANFVQEWKDRAPVKEQGNGLDDSPLLTPGMSEEDVVAALGAPIQKIRFEGREIWKYSSFSLVFENGLLTELR